MKWGSISIKYHLILLTEIKKYDISSKLIGTGEQSNLIINENYILLCAKEMFDVVYVYLSYRNIQIALRIIYGERHYSHKTIKFESHFSALICIKCPSQDFRTVSNNVLLG